MKNDETYSKNIYKDKNKQTLKSSENVLLLDSSGGANGSKSPNLLSSKAQEGNNKINFKTNENNAINFNNNSNKILDFKSNLNNLNNSPNNKNNPNVNNNNFPPLYINSNQVNNINNSNNSNNNNKFNSFNLTGMNANSPASKNLTQETFRDLFKLNSELNIHLDTNKSNRFNTHENSKNPHKASKSNFSHGIVNSLPNTNNNTKTYFNSNNNNTNNFNSKNTTSYFNNKTSKMRKSHYQRFEPELEMFNLDKYNSLVTETMGNYRVESFPADLINENNEDIMHTHNRTLGFPAFNKTLIGKSNNNLNITYGDNAFIKINVNDKEYVNPVDSLKILDTNKNIFNNISTSLINIQKMYYDKTVIGIERFNEFKKNMCKVRISNIMPKNTDFLMLFKSKDSVMGDKNGNGLINGHAQSSNSLSGLLKNNLAAKGNLNEAVNTNNSNKERSAESIEKEKILEKQREKERERERERENRRDKKKKNDIKFKNKIIRPDEMELHAYYKYSTKNFPEGREQFAFDYNLSEIVLFGGIVTNKNNHVWTLDPVAMEWDKKNTDNIPPYPRYGHTGVIHQKRIYIFGGKCKSNNYHYIADLDIFDLNDSQWFTPNFSSKASLELRRNHVADLIGNQMIIHGGMNEENKILNDAHVLSLSPLKWNMLNISEFTPGPALSGHASAVVLPMEIRYNTKTSLYKFPENLFGKIITNRMREKGWYLFGGINSDDTITNELWILRLGRKPLEWIKPNVRGKPPLPRYAHTLNYYEEGNFLITHGGRNDLLSQSFALSDTHIFDLSKMEWQEIKLFSDMDNFNVYNRCGHNSVIFTNKIIIFGGMNNMNYLGSSLFIINLDFNYKFQKEAEHENSFDSHDIKKVKGHKDKKNPYNGCLEKNEFEHVFLPPIK